jgi:TRAP-type uncharacterized transport system fused permease subunit
LAEASRRLVGWPLVIIAACFLFYALFAYIFPGDFYGKGWTVSRLATYLYLDANGIFGQALQVGASIVVVFVIFGEVLYLVGGAEFLSDFSLALMGRFRGGQAKIAIVSSSLFGNISGSAVANVVVDGAFTIPMMKKAGYPPPVAAAVEAVASTGGQIMPPVMGAAAFLMRVFRCPTPRRYRSSTGAYYVTLSSRTISWPRATHSRLAAEGSQTCRCSRRHPSPWQTFDVLSIADRRGGLGGAGGLDRLSRRAKIGWQEIVKILSNAGRGMLEIAAITGLAGVVIGVLQLTGLGFTLTLTLLNIGQSNALLLLVLTAIVSIILGMGMPTTAVYVLLAVLVAPGLAKLGIVPIAAHLFIFYFGMLSMVTPPVCMASYAAASIGKTDPIQTGWQAMRLCSIAYIVPFLFVFSPSLLLIGHWYEVALSIITAIIGAMLLGIGVVGYLFRPVRLTKRALFIAAAAGLLIPVVHSGNFATLTWVANGVGLLLAIALVTIEWLARSPTPKQILKPAPSE